MIKFIPTEITLPLRSKVLRNGLPMEDCKFPTDDLEESFHLAVYAGDEIVSVGSFFPNNFKDRKDSGYQLRGMATDTPFAGKGYGKQLVEFAVEYIKKTNAQYIWCNARTSAIQFYQKLGFVIISDEFEVEGIGPHYQMILNLY